MLEERIMAAKARRTAFTSESAEWFEHWERGRGRMGSQGLATFLPAMSAATCRQPGSNKLQNSIEESGQFAFKPHDTSCAGLTQSLVPTRHRERYQVHRRGRLQCWTRCYRTSWGKRWCQTAGASKPSASSCQVAIDELVGSVRAGVPLTG